MHLNIIINYTIMEKTIKNIIPGINEVTSQSYEEVYDKHFEEIIKNILSSAPSVKEPEIVHMLGIPAAGKTTYYVRNKEKYKHYVYIAFDSIMMAHPQYLQDVQNYGSVEAFKRWELPARTTGYELLFRAIEERKNIFFDHGGTPKCHQELLKNIKKLGYKTKMIYIHCEPEEAIKRAKVREAETKRHTPEQMIRDRVAMVKENKFIYMKIVDEFLEIL